MLQRARQRARAAGVGNLTFLEADAQTHPFTAGAFDALVSRLGTMFFDNPVAAFTNLAGALRAGARLAFLCWRELLANDWLMTPAVAALEHVPLPDLAAGDGPGPFALWDRARIHAVLDAAGFVHVDAQPVDEPLWMGDTVDDAVAYLRHTEFGQILFTGVDGDTAQRGWDSVTAALAGHVTGDGVVLGGAA